MKITSEILKKYDFEQRVIEKIEDVFPDGVEPIELMEKLPDLPYDFWHKARLCFFDTDEEVEKYEKLLAIVDCDRAINSHDVTNGKVVIRSSYVNDSSYVFDSHNVNDAHFIYRSYSVSLSNNVNGSEDVDSSSVVVHSEGVRDSTEICDSDYVNWSRNILFCSNIDDSQFIYHSNNLVDCYFCGFVQNCNHCMFCSGIEGRSYYIFNKPVDIKTFEALKQILLLNLNDEYSTFISLDGDEVLNGDKRFIFNLRYDSVFNGLSDEFFGWVGTLPNYSDEKFLNLFFKERKFENS